MVPSSPDRSQKAVPLANAVVYVIRHAEKPDSGTGLSAKGQKRAEAYAAYFNRDPLAPTPLVLSAIFAAADSKNSQRSVLTVTPTAQATGLKIHDKHADKDYTGLVTDLRDKDHGKRILVCWHHGTLPNLLLALGLPQAELPLFLPPYPVSSPPAAAPGGQPVWPGDCYDRVVVLQFDALGQLDAKASALVFENLLSGDENAPPIWGQGG